MDATPFTDFASSIRYALTPRPAPGGRVDIVLDLYRGAVPAHTRTIARIEPGQADSLLRTCRRHLERRGAHALVAAVTALPAPRRRQPAAEPRHAAPMAAFDWMFEAS